jgi:hypothetical protein
MLLRSITFCGQALMAAALSLLLAGCGSDSGDGSDPGGGQGGESGMGGSGGSGGVSQGGNGGSGGQSGGSGGQSGNPMTVEQYCAAKANLSKPWCDYLDKCCSQADKDDDGFIAPACSFGPDDPADCVKVINELLAASTLQFDGSFAQACVDELAKGYPTPPSTCSGTRYGDYYLNNHGTPSSSQIPACRKTVVGKVQKGGKCDYEMECAEGLICNGTSGNYACEDSHKAGEECTLLSDCDDGLSCVGKTPRHCGTLLGSGGQCLYTDDCQDGYTCGSKGCVQPKGPGSDCSSDMDSCRWGTGCTFTSPQTCESAQGPGASCTNTFQCDGRCDKTAQKCAQICGGVR